MVARFNRYMVECEYCKFAGYRFTYIVLIDTWWNVNLENIVSLYVTNVRFNRYMVECECRYCNYCDLVSFVLIDTWWNVNRNQVVPDEYVIAF